MTPQPNYHDWPTKAECAKALHCSTATIERMVKAGKLDVRYREVPKRRPVPVYNPIEINRLMGERQAAAFVAPPESGSGGSLVPFRYPTLPELLAGPPQPVRVPMTSKIYLTLTEAIEYSGLTKAVLMDAVRRGLLTGIKSNGWRIQRASLERF